MLTRTQALQLLHKHVKKKEILYHSLACEAVMKALARHYNEHVVPIPLDVEEWGIVGLLHDLDYEETKNKPELHTSILANEVRELVDPEMLYAMQSHNWVHNNIQPKSLMDWSISCIDELTGLIMACAAIHPSKSLKGMSPLFILSKFNNTSFQMGQEKEKIQMCEWKLEIPLPQFMELALEAMQNISDDLGFKEKRGKTT